MAKPKLPQTEAPADQKTQHDQTTETTNAAAPVDLPPNPSDAEVAAAKDVLARRAAHEPKRAAGGSAIMLDNGMKRVDYIKQEFAKGRKRGEIAKELGVAYQIVFAATKGLTAPATVAAASEAPAPTSAETPAE